MLSTLPSATERQDDGHCHTSPRELFSWGAQSCNIFKLPFLRVPNLLSNFMQLKRHSTIGQNPDPQKQRANMWQHVKVAVKFFIYAAHLHMVHDDHHSENHSYLHDYQVRQQGRELFTLRMGKLKKNGTGGKFV